MDESLKSMDMSIKQNAKDIIYWGDINLSRGDLDILKNRIILLLEYDCQFETELSFRLAFISDIFVEN